jgi:hypothetical protein
MADVTTPDLIEKNDSEIALLQDYRTSLIGKPGTERFIGDIERRIAETQKSNEILRAVR